MATCAHRVRHEAHKAQFLAKKLIKDGSRSPKPVAVFLGGGAAAGKSTMMRAGIARNNLDAVCTALGIQLLPLGPSQRKHASDSPRVLQA
jgi:hypothetical protein